MMYQLVRDLATEGIPVVVTCRVLGFSKQAYHKWRADPVTQQDWDDAHLVDAAKDIHHDDPVFGYRFICDELRAEHGIEASENRVHRLCSGHGIHSVLAKKRGRWARPKEPVHDDLVQRAFGAKAANELWFIDITEHPTAEDRPYLCAIKDAFSGRVVGYSDLGPEVGCLGMKRLIRLAYCVAVLYPLPRIGLSVFGSAACA